MKKDVKRTKFEGAIVPNPNHSKLEIDLSEVIDLDFYTIYPIAHLDYENDTWSGHDLSDNEE